MAQDESIVISKIKTIRYHWPYDPSRKQSFMNLSVLSFNNFHSCERKCQ